MIRTLTLVSLLTLLAGASLGFFVAECRASGPTVSAAPIDPALEARVEEYVTTYRLSSTDADEVRAAIRDLNRGVVDRLHWLRQKDGEYFTNLHARAQSRIDAVIARSGR